MMIQIKETKVDEMSGAVEKILHYGGKLMSCLENLEGGSEYGERDDEDMMGYDPHIMGERGGRYGNRMRGGRYGNRYGNRDPYLY